MVASLFSSQRHTLLDREGHTPTFRWENVIKKLDKKIIKKSYSTMLSTEEMITMRSSYNFLNKFSYNFEPEGRPIKTTTI